MNLAPSEEQASIAAAAADFLAKELSIARIRDLGADQGAAAIDDGTWHRCAELGWLGLGLSEEAGGVGLGLPEEVMLFRELGRFLAPGPFLSSVLGARVAFRAGQADLAESINSGETRVGMQVGDLAIDARSDDLILALDEFGGRLYRVGESQPVAGVDPGIRFARAQTAGMVAEYMDQTLLARARVLVAAELLGIIEAVRDMSASYAQTRIQFGKPIGTFQAVKHRCADMAIAAYACAAELFQAALLVEAETADAGFHAASAYVLASNGARRSTADNIQNHGGIGFTWEQDSHLFLKRALVFENLFGPQRAAYRDILAPERHEF
jgi:alkylation response protein AidB-like acyl-CoA dehydrogenase